MPTYTLTHAVARFVREPSVALLVTIACGFAAARAAFGTALALGEIGLALAVVAYWPVQEWWMHRWLLHAPPLRIGTRTIEPSFARMHREHHRRPDHLPLVFLPPSHVLGALAVFTGLAWLLTRDAGWTCTFMVAAAASTLLYEWTHFLTHTRYVPRGRLYRRIWKHHRLHHFKHEGYWFAFTVPWIDRWLGTGPDPAQVERSAHARTLGGDPRDR